MQAVCLYGPRDLRVENDIPEPVPGPGEVLLAPEFSGICGSDLHIWEGGSRHIVDAPMILGHEFSARIVELGPDVRVPGLVVGALVAVEPMWTCGRCGPCRTGAYNLCRKTIWHGISAKGGGMSDRTCVRADMVHVLPEELDARQGALVEPVSVSHHAVGRAALAPGESALVLGAGPIGMATALDLYARGIEHIIVSEPSEQRRAAVNATLARVGAEAHVLDPTAIDDLPGAVRDLTDGQGAHAVIDAAGVEAAFHAGLAAARPGGRMITVAVYGKPITFHPMAAFLGEIDILSSCAYRDDFPEVIDLMARGAYPLDDWVRTIPTSEVPDAFPRLHAGQDMKLLVDLGRS